MTIATEGWAWPEEASQPHYVRDGVSLCRGVSYFGTHFAGGPNHPIAGAGCPDCQRLVREEQMAGAAA